MVNINYKKFLLLSLGISVMIFTAGLLLGISLDDTKTSDIISNINQNELNSESYNVEKDFLNVFGGDKCTLSNPRLNDLSEESAKIGRLLTKYESTNTLKNPEFNYLKRKYTLLEIKTYTLFTSLKKECNYNYTTILFFYDNNDDTSTRQGYVLDTLVKISQNIHIFSFDRNFNDPALETLKIHYNITQSPSLIINNREKKEGLIDLDLLLKSANE